MIIKFNKIRLSNFMSFGDSDIELDIPGYTLVRGVNNSGEDFATSNGSGKSSIWEAISWALTGNTIRGCKNVSNINGSDGALVELTFHVDNDEYIITRTKDHSKLKSSLKILINGQDKSGKGIRDSEKLLAQYLPELNSYLIGSVIILGQGLPQRFTNNTPSGRKDVLEKLSKSDFMIEDIKKRLNDRVSVFNDKKRNCEDLNLSLNTEKNVLIQSKSAKQREYDSIESIDILNNKKSFIESQLSDLNDTCDKEKNAVNDLFNQLSTLKTKLQEVKAYNDNHKNEIKLEYEGKIHAVEIDIATINANILSLSSEINKKESITDVCPTCGQKLAGVIKPDTTEDKIKLSEFNTQLNSLKESKDNLIKNRDDAIYSYHVNTREEVLDFESEIEKVQEQYNEHCGNQHTLERSISDLNSQLNSINNNIYNATTLKDNLLKEIEGIDNKLVDIDNKLLYNDNDLNITNSHIEVLNKINNLIKRDFRGYLLTSVIDYLDTRAKNYCYDIFNHKNMSFELNGNDINIMINGKEYEQLSGGEKQKIDLIVQLSIRDMLCKYSNFSSNIFVLDEIFDNLDEIGSEQILNLISSKLEDVSSIYVVTHHASIPVPVDRELLVVKDSTGISRIEG